MAFPAPLNPKPFYPRSYVDLDMDWIEKSSFMGIAHTIHHELGHCIQDRNKKRAHDIVDVMDIKQCNQHAIGEIAQKVNTYNKDTMRRAKHMCYPHLFSEVFR